MRSGTASKRHLRRSRLVFPAGWCYTRQKTKKERTGLNTHIQGFLSALRSIWRKSDGIRLSDLRRDRAIYFLAYTLELVLYAVRQRFLPIRVGLFGFAGSTVIYVAHVLASLGVMMLWSARFRPLIRVSVAVMLAGFIPFIFLPEGYLRLAFGVIAYAGLGGAVTSARCGYAFAANNAERLVGILLMLVGVAFVKLASSLGAAGFAVSAALPLLLLGGLSWCLLRFREEDFTVKEKADKGDARGLYWAFVFFTAYFTIDGYLWNMTDISLQPKYTILCLGMLAAAFLLFAALVWFRLNTWFLWNLFFFCALAMALFALFAPQLGTEVPHYLFSGLAILGWPLCIYMLGCAQRRFASYALLKRCTLIFVLLTPFTTISDDVLYGLVPEHYPLIALIYVLVIVFGLLILSPFSYRHLFAAEWESDLHRSDMRLLQDKVEEVDRFGGYDLTPRQREVAALLLAAKTRRQIAGELGLSESTVKMHTSDLYRKLGINSRVELFRLFGVAETGEDRSDQP